MFKSGITYQIPHALTGIRSLYVTLTYLLNQFKSETDLQKCYLMLKEILIIYTQQKISNKRKIIFKNHIFNNKMFKYCKYIKTYQSYLHQMFPIS